MPGSELAAEGSADFSCAAVVVAGGASRRLNHVPKASLSDGTSTLLDCALEAVAAASPRVVVGPESLPLPSGVLRTRENPPFSGPAAAIHAGLECIAADCERSQAPMPEWCLILGVDTPRIAPAVQQLIAAARGAERAADFSSSTGSEAPAASEAPTNSEASAGFWGVSEGIYQPLVGIYRFEAIRSVFSTGTTDASVRSFLRRLNPVAVEMSAADTADVDTWEQAQALGYTTSLWSSY
ncbi:molybdenum cofactor guanylyltransferase [uncultured Rothia sp.]|uniref:molybdenum cofactor guanylyltransferase n=1 Tax=uncultured Rothia sp. TaxID=316088 RepID=UPI0026359BE5|nr:NTP transferase domain-containing protein [uncultured Rothia sp.]